MIFDLYLFEEGKLVRERRCLRYSMEAKLGLPQIGDLLEMNDFSKAVHNKYEVVQVHRFFTLTSELSHPRVYVREVEA